MLNRDVNRLLSSWFVLTPKYGQCTAASCETFHDMRSPSPSAALCPYQRMHAAFLSQAHSFFVGVFFMVNFRVIEAARGLVPKWVSTCVETALRARRRSGSWQLHPCSPHSPALLAPPIFRGASLPYREPAFIPVPAYNWNGFYVGANVGNVWSHADSVTTDTATGALRDQQFHQSQRPHLGRSDRLQLHAEPELARRRRSEYPSGPASRAPPFRPMPPIGMTAISTILELHAPGSATSSTVGCSMQPAASPGVMES